MNVKKAVFFFIIFTVMLNLITIPVNAIKSSISTEELVELLISDTADDTALVTRRGFAVAHAKILGIPRDYAVTMGLYSYGGDYPRDIRNFDSIDNGYIMIARNYGILITPETEYGREAFFPNQPVKVSEALALMNNALVGTLDKKVTVWSESVPEASLEQALALGIITENEYESLTPETELNYALFRTLLLRMLEQERHLYFHQGDSFSYIGSEIRIDDSGITYGEWLADNLWVLYTEEVYNESKLLLPIPKYEDIESISIESASAGNLNKNYFTADENEIIYLSYLLRVLPEEVLTEIPSDRSGGWHIYIDFGARATSYTLLPNAVITSEETYRITEDDYRNFLSVVNGLRTKELDLSFGVSFEPSAWMRSEDIHATNTIEVAIERGLLPRRFRINYPAPITRLEACQLLSHASDIEEDVEEIKEMPFKDTDDRSVQLLYSAGCINGKSEEEFCPYDPITREEYATLLLRIWIVQHPNTSMADDTPYTVFKDHDEISPWARDAATYVASGRIMIGWNGEFHPQDFITKEQIVSARFSALF